MGEDGDQSLWGSQALRHPPEGWRWGGQFSVCGHFPVVEYTDRVTELREQEGPGMGGPGRGRQLIQVGGGAPGTQLGLIPDILGRVGYLTLARRAGTKHY